VTTTVDNDGAWSVSGINASSLVGSVTYTVTQTDVAGTTTATQTTGTASAPVAITTAPNITSANVNHVSASGTGTPNDVVTVIISDTMGHSTAPASTTVFADGTWSVENIVALSLIPGNVTYTATQTDAAGNTMVTAPATDTVTAPGTITTAPNTTSTNVGSVMVSGSTPEQSKKGLTSVTVAFDAALEAASAENSSNYHVFGAVTKVVKHRRETLYTKPIKIASVSYNSATDTANVNLAKPVKGKVEIQVSGTFTTTSGAQETVTYTNTL
jgi:hypothetical protein